MKEQIRRYYKEVAKELKSIARMTPDEADQMWRKVIKQATEFMVPGVTTEELDLNDKLFEKIEGMIENRKQAYVRW